MMEPRRCCLSSSSTLINEWSVASIIRYLPVQYVKYSAPVSMQI